MDSDDLIIGFDLGTSVIKAVLVNTEGRLLSHAERDVAFVHPSEHTWEIDSHDYYKRITDLIRRLTDASGDPRRIKAISFCAASGNTILLDSRHGPLGNAISWLDTRTVGRERELWRELDPERIYTIVGWPWGGRFPLAHLAWLRENQPSIWGNAHYYTMLSDYVYLRLCGSLVTDPSKATTFYLQDQVAHGWSTELMDFLGVDEAALSKIVPSGTPCGNIDRKASEETGLTMDTVVVTGSFDHPSAARGTGVFGSGDTLVSAGTSWVVFAPVEKREIGISAGMLVDPYTSPDGKWGVMLSLTAVADNVERLLRTFIKKTDKAAFYDEFNRLAGESEPGSGGLLTNPLVQDGAGNGICHESKDKRHMARALMEGCALLMNNRIAKLCSVRGAGLDRIALVGGPTNSPLWSKILCDVVGSPMAIPELGQHAGAMGAAIMAGVGCGIYDDELEGWMRMRGGEKLLTPDAALHARYREVYDRFCQEFSLL